MTTLLNFLVSEQDFSHTPKADGLFWQVFLLMEHCFRKLCLVLVIANNSFFTEGPMQNKQ